MRFLLPLQSLVTRLKKSASQSCSHAGLQALTHPSLLLKAQCEAEMNWLKQIFRKPSPLELAARELVDAEHALLVAQTGKDWAEMSVEYNTRRINRLKQHIEGASK